MRAALIAPPGPFRIEDVTVRAPEPGDVIVRTQAAWASMPDAIEHSQGGTLAAPHIGGHSGAGIVEAVGHGVDRVRPGDRVIVVTRPICGACFWCVNDQAEQCVSSPPRAVADTAAGEALMGTARIGAFAEYMKVWQTTTVTVETDLPDGVLAALGGDVAAGFGAALNVAEIVPGSSAAVLGAGAFGLAVVQGAVVAGAGRLVAIDDHAGRQALASRLGATAAVGYGDAPAAAAEASDGRGVDTCFVADARPESVLTAFALTRPGGQIVVAGFGPNAGTVTLPVDELSRSSRRILSSRFGGLNPRRDLPKLIGLVERGTVQIEPLIAGTVDLVEVDTAFVDGAELTRLGTVVVP